LGNGSNTDSNVPVDVAGITGATQISAGGIHSCGVVAGGAVKCWGYNGFGELGDGSTTNSYVPVEVVAGT
jgi:alpha-tubulin suppressor-like RCC1 family protein